MIIEPNYLYNMDCLEGMKMMPDHSVDAIICDPPYGTMSDASIEGWIKAKRNLSWDAQIPTQPLFEQYERILRRGGIIILFSQEPYTSHLRTFKARNIDFLYPMVWIKDIHGNPLIAKNAPLSYFEDINVFAKRNPSCDYAGVHPLRPYFAKVFSFIGKTKRQIMEEIGQTADHCFRFGSSQFTICTAETYQRLIDKYGIETMEGFVCYEELRKEDDVFFVEKENKKTFNLPEGKSSISNVLYFPKDKKTKHPTQKPVDLIAYLVRTYSNPGDLILDNCMGSGTTAIACIREHRNWIGFELNEEYYTKAVERITNETSQPSLF